MPAVSGQEDAWLMIERLQIMVTERTVAHMVWIGFITVLACLDLCLKELIEERKNEEFPKNLEGSRGKIILHKSHNSGFPFGFLKEKQELVKLVPVAAASAVFGALAYLMGKKGHLAEKTAFSLTVGGALSNIIDRYKRGYVVDYFSFNVKGLKKVILNLGDLFVFAGMALALLVEAVQWVREAAGKNRT